MPTYVYCLSFLSALLLTVLPLRAEEGWLTHLETAKDVAQQDHRLILIDFWATWCGPCKKMEVDIWSDSEVQLLKRKFVPLKVDVDRDPATAGRYQVNAMPTIMIVDGFGQILHQHVGYLDKQAMRRLLSSFPDNVRSIHQAYRPVLDSPKNPYLLFTLATEFQQSAAELDGKAQQAFLSHSDQYFRLVAKYGHAANDALLLEKNQLFRCLSHTLENRPRRSIRMIERKIGLKNISPDNLPIAHYVLARAFLKLGDKDQAQEHYQTLRQLKGREPYQTFLKKAFL